MKREECEKAHEILSNALVEREYFNDKFRTYQTHEQELGIFYSLIKEHFDNPPLKFEELKIAEPIWENEKLGWVFIKYIIKSTKELCCIDVDGKVWMLKYEYGNFYRKQVE